MKNDFLDNGEATEILRVFFRKWVRQNLHHLIDRSSVIPTRLSELQIVRNMPGRISYQYGKIAFPSDKETLLFNEMQYGSARWPQLMPLDAIDRFLQQEVDKVIDEVVT